jgi:type VI secretion system secreted protein VgrG
LIGSPRIFIEADEVLALKAPTIILDAGQTISIKGPGGFVVIDAQGVTIDGDLIRINSGGGPALSAPASTLGGGPIENQVQSPEAPAGADGARPGYPSDT